MAIAIDALKRRRMALLVILSMDIIYFFSYFQRVAVPGSIFDQLQKGLGLSAAAVTSLSAIFLWVYGGMQVFCGLIVDRFGAFRVILTGGALLAVGSILFPLSHSLAALYATRALVGLGASLAYLSIVKEIDVRFHDRSFSMVLSMSMFFGYGGGLMGTAPFARSVALLGWREPLLIAGVLCAVSVVVTWFVGRIAPAHVRSRKPPSPWPMLKRVFANIHSYPVAIAGAIAWTSYFIVQAVVGAKVLGDVWAMDAKTASLHTFEAMLAAMIGAVAAGFVSRLMGNRRKPLLVLACTCTLISTSMMLAVLTRHAGTVLLLPSYLILGVSSVGTPIFGCSMKELNAPDAAATSVGVYNGSCYLAVALVSSLVGFVMDSFKSRAVVTATAVHYPAQAYTTIFLGILALEIVGLVASVFIKETRGSNACAEM